MGDGVPYCSWREDFAAMFRAVNQCPTDAEVEAIIAERDKDQTDQFTCDTWLRVMDSPAAKDFVRHEDLMECIRQFDKEGTGFIKVPMFRYLLQAVGEKLDPDMADDFVDFAIAQADKEKTGEIEYDLLCKALLERDPGISASL